MLMYRANGARIQKALSSERRSEDALFTPLFTQEGMWQRSLSPSRGLLYKSSTDCVIQAVQGEGFLSLYKGFLPSWLRMVKTGRFCFFLCFLYISLTCTLQVFFILLSDVWPHERPIHLPFKNIYCRGLFFFQPFLRIMFPFLTD